MCASSWHTAQKPLFSDLAEQQILVVMLGSPLQLLHGMFISLWIGLMLVMMMLKIK